MSEPCARGCGRAASWWYGGPERDQPEAWVCTSCYEAEEFAPGHVRDGDRRHFMATGCRDCCARTVAGMTLEQVEHWYHDGYVGQDVYEAYCHAWATSATHSAAWDSWLKPPAVPEVVRLVAIIREVNARRAAVRH
jgi:hypothetical protein